MLAAINERRECVKCIRPACLLISIGVSFIARKTVGIINVLVRRHGAERRAEGRSSRSMSFRTCSCGNGGPRGAIFARKMLGGVAKSGAPENENALKGHQAGAQQYNRREALARGRKPVGLGGAHQLNVGDVKNIASKAPRLRCYHQNCA